MAIFIHGRTTCRISGHLVGSTGALVGFPNMDMPPGLEQIRDACLLRSSLDGHPRRPELLEAWRQHWTAQAAVPGGSASVNEHGVLMILTGRFVFAALDSFVDIEDEVVALEPLRTFLFSFDGHTPFGL